MESGWRHPCSNKANATTGGNGEQSLPDTAPGAYENTDGRSFFEWLQIGVALTLPLILFGIIAIVVLAWMNSR